jgi:hypothetical protein
LVAWMMPARCHQRHAQLRVSNGAI